MTIEYGSEVYKRLGVRPVINASGNTTTWGGSTPSAIAKKAMDEAGTSFAEMEELLEGSGQFIADLLGVEAAYVTSGCYAALVLSTAACMTGDDPDKMARIPDVSGMKSEIILQRKQCYSFDRSYTIPGGKLVLVGDEDGCTLEQLEGAIGPNTAAVAYLVRPDWGDSVVSYVDAVEVAHKHDVPLIGDCAAQNYPLEYFRTTAQTADLACIGGKYIGAPHSTGFVAGKKVLVDVVVSHGFIASPMSFGRGMKLDRQEIIGLVAAIEDWFTMNHEDRLMRYTDRFSVIEQGLAGILAVREIKIEPNDDFTLVGMAVVLATEALGRSASDVVKELDNGVPRVRVASRENDTIVLNAHNLSEGEDAIIADTLRNLLTS